MARLLRRAVMAIGLPMLAYGVYVSAKTIQLYAFGSEVQGIVVNLHYGDVPARPVQQIRRPFDQVHESPERRRYAVIRHGTERGQMESRIRINLASYLEMNEAVNVVYLPGSSWVAIRGEAVYQEILLLPLSMLIIGSLITGFSLTLNRPIFVQVRQKSDTVPVPDDPPAGHSRPAGILDAIGLRLLWAGIIAAVGGITFLILFTLGSYAYQSFLSKMRHEETLYKPLVADGVSVAAPNIQDRGNICPPMSISGLSHATASSGDIIELHGDWSAFTSNKVPHIRGAGTNRRLKVIEWTAGTIRAELPGWLDAGKYNVGVMCYFNPNQPKHYAFSGYMKIQVK
jgi:hypothetical protein